MGEKMNSPFSSTGAGFAPTTFCFARESLFDRLGRRGFAAVAALLSLGLSVFFFSPSLWVMAQPMPGSLEWTRALAFMQQCDHPFSRDLPDPGLCWRLLPPVCCFLLGLHGKLALIFQPLGLIALLTQIAWWGERITGNRRLSLLTTVLVATTSATLTVTGWLGLNDAWYLFFLVLATFAPSRLPVFTACSLGPWVDERFLLGLPLAFLLRISLLTAETSLRPRSLIVPVIGGLAPYLLVRLGWSLFAPPDLQSRYLGDAFHAFAAWLPYAPLGWFVGLRFGWLPVLGAFFLVGRRLGWLAATACSVAGVAALGSLLLVSADLSRAAPLLLPAMLAGCWKATSAWSLSTVQMTLGLIVTLNLALPAAHVTYTKVCWISPLPLELIRLLRHG